MNKDYDFVGDSDALADREREVTRGERRGKNAALEEEDMMYRKEDCDGEREEEKNECWGNV